MRTRTVNNNNTPEFNEEFCMLVTDTATQVSGGGVGGQVCGCEGVGSMSCSGVMCGCGLGW